MSESSGVRMPLSRALDEATHRITFQKSTVDREARIIASAYGFSFAWCQSKVRDRWLLNVVGV